MESQSPTIPEVSVGVFTVGCSGDGNLRVKGNATVDEPGPTQSRTGEKRRGGSHKANARAAITSQL